MNESGNLISVFGRRERPIQQQTSLLKTNVYDGWIVFQRAVDHRLKFEEESQRDIR